MIGSPREPRYSRWTDLETTGGMHPERRCQQLWRAGGSQIPSCAIIRCRLERGTVLRIEESRDPILYQFISSLPNLDTSGLAGVTLSQSPVNSLVGCTVVCREKVKHNSYIDSSRCLPPAREFRVLKPRFTTVVSLVTGAESRSASFIIHQTLSYSSCLCSSETSASMEEGASRRVDLRLISRGE